MEEQPTPAASHLELLASARAVRRAAEADDVERVHGVLGRLRRDLVAHLDDEAAAVEGLPGAVPEVVAEGQRRLRRLVDELVVASAGGAAACSCLLRSAELEQALRRQARLEARLLSRHPSGPGA